MCLKKYVSVVPAIAVVFGILQLVDVDLYSSPCILKVGDTLSRFIRKPLNCTICADLKNVDSVEYIDKIKFENKYAYSGRPLVVRGAAKTWTAIESFDFYFFKILNSLSDLSSCQFIKYNDEFRTLDDVFNLDSKRISDTSLHHQEPWYCGWSVCDPLAVNILRQYYEKPYFLPDTSENYIVDWIFMGTNGYGANLHIDDVRLPSWQAQIKGIKRWTLKTPAECTYMCRDTFHVDVFPGDIIVLDTNLWYHATEVMSTNISITVGAEYD